MARRFTIELLMNLAKSIGANPNKFMGTKTNISFLGKGPTKNPLFQSLLPGPETSKVLLGPERIEGTISAVNDAMGYASAGKLNSIQIEMLGKNLLGLKDILHPPVLPSATVTDIAPGIAGLRRFPKETHKFMGRPLKGKDFSEIDRMVMEGKIPDARGRTWNLKETGPQRYNRLTGTQETGPEAFNAALNQKTGMSRAIARELLLQDTRIKLKPEELFMLKSGKGEPLDLMRKYYGKSMMNLDAWLDDFLPRTTLPPRDLATRVLSEVELIPQFAEGGLAGILQVPTKRAKGGRIGFFKGAQADTAEGKAMSPGTSADHTPGAGHRDAWKREAHEDFSQVLKKIKRKEENPTQVVPIQSFTGDFNQLDKLGLQARNKNLYAAGLLSIEDVMKGDIKPDIYAGISGNNFNIEGQKTKDMTGLYGNTSIGPVNVQGSYEDFDGDVNRKVGASTQLGNFGLGVNYNFEGNPTFGVGYNTPNLDMGVNYNLEGNPTFGLTYKKTFNKGGLAGILEV